MRIQVLADPEYRSSFESYLAASHELVSEDPKLIFDATFLDLDYKYHLLAEYAPGNAPVITNTLTVSASAVAAQLDPPFRFGKMEIVGVPMLPHHFTGQKHLEYALPLQATYSADAVMAFISTLGKTGEQIADCVAGVFPRTLAMIVNEAAFAVQESVATATDIDVAMKLGTNYPKGPLAWCDEIGACAFVEILDALARENGPERYRVAALLRRYAEAGTKFLS